MVSLWKSLTNVRTLHNQIFLLPTYIIIYVYPLEMLAALDFSWSFIKCACSISSYVLLNSLSPVSPNDASCTTLGQELYYVRETGLWANLAPPVVVWSAS